MHAKVHKFEFEKLLEIATNNAFEFLQESGSYTIEVFCMLEFLSICSLSSNSLLHLISCFCLMAFLLITLGFSFLIMLYAMNSI